MAEDVVLERNTYRNRASYRYIVARDKLPQEEAEGREPMARIRLVDPVGEWEFFISSYDPDTHIAYGLGGSTRTELDYDFIDMQTVNEFRGEIGPPILRDLSWSKTLSLGQVKYWRPILIDRWEQNGRRRHGND